VSARFSVLDATRLASRSPNLIQLTFDTGYNITTFVGCFVNCPRLLISPPRFIQIEAFQLFPLRLLPSPANRAPQMLRPRRK
jgi:hypothetical protein